MGIVEKNSPYILGIDLGTSNSAIAVFVKGQAEIIPIDGDKVCPSIVHVRPGGEILVGKQARPYLRVDPENTVASIKRYLGEDWKKEFAGLPDKEYTPADISAEILSRLISGARSAGTIDLRGTPKFVVICIPANFKDPQKQATSDACDLANLDMLYLLEEPVAAAIAYGMDQERDQTILVYDLGGGTFDVSILKVDTSKADGTDVAAKFDVLAKEGVPKLGGDDFDYEIMKMAAEKFEAESGINVLDTKKDQGVSVKKIREAQQKLSEVAETAKRELTLAKSASLSIPNLIADESGTPHSMEMEITRDQFNEAIRDLIMNSKQAIQDALNNSKLTIEDIDRIILVGGSTRVPLVKEILVEMFGKEPYGDTDPDTAVARGAAILGATLGVPTDKLDETEEVREEDQAETDISIKNIVTHYLGIETTGGRFNCLIEKGLEIPSDEALTTTKEYTTPRDNMTELAIRIYQSDKEAEYVGKEGVKCIGEFFLKGIPPKPRRQERISVTFEIDKQNLLKVSATSSGSEGKLEIEQS